MNWDEFIKQWEPQEAKQKNYDEILTVFDECIATAQKYRDTLVEKDHSVSTIDRRVISPFYELCDVIAAEARRCERKGVDKKTWAKLQSLEEGKPLNTNSFQKTIHHPVEIEYGGFRYYLGDTWLITFVLESWGSNFFFFPYKIGSKNEKVEHKDYFFVHPHVHPRGEPCWGTFSDTVMDLSKKWKFRELDEIIKLFLEDYNPDSPTCPIDHWINTEENKRGFEDGTRKLPPKTSPSIETI